MIRQIVAIDEKRGLANDKGIPWDLPSDKAYFREQTEHGTVLMGYRTYEEFEQPLPNRRNLVAARPGSDIREGFELVEDAENFLKSAKEDIWVIGGAGLFAATIDLADELYLTHLEGDFDCTKFFPEYKQDFELKSKSEPITENGIIFYYAVYRRKQTT